ncbi:MAG: hypothetical protein LUD68_11055 [Rikenellaceae bacterium]|nr:hypothetical protein [Rikenellaceae bacterium]
MVKHGNSEGPDRPVDNPQYSEFVEINPRQGITRRDLMSADLNDEGSNYEGWNGITDIWPSEYGELTDETQLPKPNLKK